MEPVFQTRFGAPGGNCLAACTASLLEISLGDVPDNWHLLEWEEQKEAYVNFLERFNVFPVIVPTHEMSPLFIECLLEDFREVYVGVSFSKIGKLLTSAHRVIYRGGKLAHNPDPNGRCEGVIVRIEFWAVIDPSKIKGGTNVCL